MRPHHDPSVVPMFGHLMKWLDFMPGTWEAYRSESDDERRGDEPTMPA